MKPSFSSSSSLRTPRSSSPPPPPPPPPGGNLPPPPPPHHHRLRRDRLGATPEAPGDLERETGFNVGVLTVGVVKSNIGACESLTAEAVRMIGVAEAVRLSGVAEEAARLRDRRLQVVACVYQRERESVCVCERERERVCVCVRVYVTWRHAGTRVRGPV